MSNTETVPVFHFKGGPEVKTLDSGGVQLTQRILAWPFYFAPGGYDAIIETGRKVSRLGRGRCSDTLRTLVLKNDEVDNAHHCFEHAQVYRTGLLLQRMGIIKPLAPGVPFKRGTVLIMGDTRTPFLDYLRQPTIMTVEVSIPVEPSVLLEAAHDTLTFCNTIGAQPHLMPTLLPEFCGI